jgi:hypothetical protein
MKEILNFDKLRFKYQYTKLDILKAFLCEIFNDLSAKPILTKDKTDKKQVQQDSFITFIGLPYFLGERIFTVLAKGNKKVIQQTDFVEGLVKLYNGNLAEAQEIIFNILDFDNDGFIVAQDVRLLLSFLCKNKDQTGRHDCIKILIDKFFMGKECMNFEGFTRVVENKYSDIFLILICFIYENKLYNDKLLEIYNLGQSKVETVLSNYNPISKELNVSSKKELIFPSSALRADFGINTDFRKFLKGETVIDAQMNEELRELENFEIGEIDLESLIKQPGIKFSDYGDDEYSNLTGLKGIEKSKTLNIGYKHSSGADSKYASTKASVNINLNESVIQLPEGDIEDYVYNLTKGKKRFWLVLCGRDLLYFKKDNKLILKGLHNLANAFLNDDIKEVIKDDIKFYYFSIIFPSKERLFGFKNLEQCKKWVNMLKLNLNHRSIDDYYKQHEQIGKGSYGIVKLGHCRQTGRKVAIKVILKGKYEDKIGLVKNELEILKFCKHTNIVEYIDSFETSEHIYIVTEYFGCGDLLSYLEFNNANNESRVKQIIKQIALGVEYLHSHGIMHRDLKPMNILVSDFGQFPKIKIIDFGFSGLFGHGELFDEIVGTIHFSAPELLQRQGYNYKIDLWSLGVMLYYLILGYFPFDDERRSKNAVVRKILGGEYVIPRCVNFFIKDLIYCCLEKDFDKRINIKDFLDHSWFNK